MENGNFLFGGGRVRFQKGIPHGPDSNTTLMLILTLDLPSNEL